MKLIFLYGLPATGKLTVAQELSGLTGFKVFHNHLVVDLLLSLFAFGSAPFVELREDIWLSVFEQSCKSRLPGLIFTFVPEPTVRPRFLTQTLITILEGGGDIDFFELVCPFAELKQRICNPSRLKFQKLTSVSLFEELYSQGRFDSSFMPTPRLTIDTSLYGPAEAAVLIRDTLALGGSGIDDEALAAE